MEFIEIKQAYVNERQKQRKLIVKHLQKNGYSVVEGGSAGKGRKDYTSGGNLKIPYDLSNWKYIEAEKNGNQFFVSLQSFDHDPNSGNQHVLMDRIGIYHYLGHRKKDYDAFDAFSKMQTTEIELPLSDEDLNNLLDLLEQMEEKIV